MLTCCAACSTAFRVTAEQLLAHQGKVRCGACNTVFSALDNLVHAQAGAELEDGASNGATDVAAPAHATKLSIASLTSPDSTTAALVLGAARATTEDATLPLPPLAPGIGSAHTAPGPMPGDTTAAAATQTDAEAESNADAQAKTNADAQTLVDASAETPFETPDEIPADAAPAPARTRFAWWSAAGALAAICGLVLQGAYFYRNDIAAHYPETKPALAALCQTLTCTFDAPRDAQAITIESHDLQAEPSNKNVLALIALLRNRAAFAQDAPHLELTLTDAQDAALARRVFAPREYVVAAQMAPNSELPVRIMLDASQIKAAGYRLYAFYP